jgi:NADPH:quinone reductase
LELWARKRERQFAIRFGADEGVLNLPPLKGSALLGVDLAQIGRREPDLQARVMSQLFAWLKEKTVVPVVGHVFAFDDFRDAFKTMTTRAALGKLVVGSN